MIAAIIAAGGRGGRVGAERPKQLLELGGRAMLWWSVETFLRHPRIDSVVVVLPPDIEIDLGAEHAREVGKPLKTVPGGARRQDSVAAGFAALDERVEIVVVHDAARPFVEPVLIDRAIDGAREAGAAICAVPAHDTVKVAQWDRAGDQERAWIERTLPRDSIFLAQTPQAFRRRVLEDAIRLGQSQAQATDEAFLAEQAGHRVRLVEGSPRNMKITTAKDLALAQAIAEGSPHDWRVGCGYDLHRLVEGRRLVLGGVEIPFERGLFGHSDADVLCHAVTDAVLGAAGAGNIGEHFPDTDERWRDASSVEMLRRAACLVRERGYGVVNIDAVVVAERPKIGPHVPAIAATLAAALGVQPSEVSVKGKTGEGIGEIGRGEAIACHAVALLRRQPTTDDGR